MNNESRISTLVVTIFGSCMLTATAAAADPLTIVSWGGSYEESQRKAYHEPFTEMTGTEIVQVSKSSNGPAGIRAQVESGDVNWDLVDVIPGAAMRMCDQGLVERIDYDEVLANAPNGDAPTSDFLLDLPGCFVPEVLFGTVWATRSDIWDGEQPNSVADIWNTADYPGRRAMQKIPAGNLEWALMADGVPVNEIYDVLETEEGISRAFSKLAELKEHTVWWAEAAQPPQLLADKEVAFASSYNGRFFHAQVVEEQPFEIIWDGQVLEPTGWVVPKGRLTEDVKQYLHFATDTQRLADQAKYISYGPARASSASLVGTHAESGVDMKPHMPTNPKHMETAIIMNIPFWADNGDALSERFNAWLAL